MYDALTSTPAILAATAAWGFGVVGGRLWPQIAYALRRVGQFERRAKPEGLPPPREEETTRVAVLPSVQIPALPDHIDPPQGVPRKLVFDTRLSRPLQPAVAAERFAAWMRANEYTDYIWVGELDLQYQVFCREENYFPIEAKALRELLYQLPGVLWDRPRLGGAKWERFRRQMADWYAARGESPPKRPVVIRILPADLVKAARVRERPDAYMVESGTVTPPVRTSAAIGRKANHLKVDGRVQMRPTPINGSDFVMPSTRVA